MPSLNDWAKQRVTSILGKSEKVQKSYKSEIKGLGSMLLQNGLYGTIAYYKVREKDSSKEILDHLKSLLLERMDIPDITEMNPINDFDYIKAQTIVLEAVKWLRRYADILIEGEDNG
ncbi:MAG TPA: type III-B CRISPR module-associated protein Cmr5 [Mesotoga sp.]|nr:type III-B CRISPR module-associated protein Cmr5 [Mesotoga sp.]